MSESSEEIEMPAARKALKMFIADLRESFDLDSIPAYGLGAGMDELGETERAHVFNVCLPVEKKDLSPEPEPPESSQA